MVTITISGAEKSGALARIAAFLVRKGYPLKGQQVAESASGAKLVKVSLDVSHLDKAKFAAEMKSLSPDFRVDSVEGAQSAAPSIKDIAEQFPDIASLVRAYGESFGSESRDRELAEAGKKIGAFQYEKEWSLGSPLKMPVVLRYGQNRLLRIPDRIHAGILGCGSADAEHSCSQGGVQGEGRFALHLHVRL